MKRNTWIVGAPLLLASLAGAAHAAPLHPDRLRDELAVGVLAHGIRKPFRASPPTGFALYEGEEERDTTDIQLVYRTRPLAGALHPRLAARLQINTAGRTNFASVGAEWRQYVLDGRVYGQTGIGVTIHDGYRFTPDPFVAGLPAGEAQRRYDLYATRTAFGSRLLFNPSLSLGIRLTDQVAIEAAFEHFSHAGLFSGQNPGINNFGVRLVYGLGRK